MDGDDTVSTEKNGVQQESISVLQAAGRPPSIIITVSLNLLKFQGEMKPIIKGMFKFQTTRNSIKVSTKDMANWH